MVFLRSQVDIPLYHTTQWEDNTMELLGDVIVEEVGKVVDTQERGRRDERGKRGAQGAVAGGAKL